MASAIRIETVADLLAHPHTLDLYCRHCARWSEAPLEKLAARVIGDRPIQRLSLRCITCGAPAMRQLRPPALSPTSGGGWRARVPLARRSQRFRPHPPR
jgi:hypothetical protein